MAIDAKQSLMSKIETRSADILTAAEMPRLMRVLSDVLQGFRVEALTNEAWSMDEDDMLESFIASMNVQGRSNGTIYRYRYLICKFMTFAKTPTREINVYHIRNWITAEKARGIQESTLEGYRQVLSSYFGWLFREGLIEKNPVVNVGVIKAPKKLKKIYSRADIERLTRECKTVRDQAIVHFLASTGCRISEMTGLNRDAVNLTAGEVVVYGKGGKERTVYMDDVAVMLLRKYLEERNDDSEILFTGRNGERLKPGGVRIMLNKIGNAAGVEHVHPHKFRRTLATEMSRRGVQLQEIKAILGHESLDTTMEYIVLNKEDTKSSYRRFA